MFYLKKHCAHELRRWNIRHSFNGRKPHHPRRHHQLAPTVAEELADMHALAMEREASEGGIFVGQMPARPQFVELPEIISVMA